MLEPSLNTFYDHNHNLRHRVNFFEEVATMLEAAFKYFSLFVLPNPVSIISLKSSQVVLDC